MEIRQPGKYRLIRGWYGNSVGTVIEITQIDEKWHKVTGPGMAWEHWELPVEPIVVEMACNCDLDNWQPEKSTGHSGVCRI